MVKNIAIFSSGSGSNAENISCFFKPIQNINVVLILTDNSNAFVINRAKKLNIDFCIFSKKQFSNYVFVKNILEKYSVDFIVLAGFLLKIPEKMVADYLNKIINIHPALLPKYGGKGMYGNRVHKEVLINNEKESGITIHFINKHYDKGKIVFQKKCKLVKRDTVESLSKKIQKLEHKYFPEIIFNLINMTK